ncbi:MAG: hypothetical protein KZQ97_08805 [Candidatus Thiodiazotropha sp. (ex Dulcina madagascariensis)]|nr:hypothetical protein [Candidatus Thiodiazotropha sp. (ex Dulcina madagascariensis)]
MKYLLILGNGFSIDLLEHLGKHTDIPLSNLFAHGDKLLWPAIGHNAFISFRNTPNLWILGVRPSNSAEKNNQIIENIITCANAYYLKEPGTRSFGQTDKRSIYIDAYRELVVYLKYLFVSFDKEVPINKHDISNWPWARLFNSLSSNEIIEKIDIVTFNYDVWLERVLDALEIEYNVSVINENDAKKFSVTKPHGSISFIHSKKIELSAFSINYESDYLEGSSSDFSLTMEDLDVNTPIIPIIPPAGDSERFNLTWAGSLRRDAVEKAGSLQEGDHVILCGLSYWHVDRREIDDLLMKVSDKVSLSYINPSPPETFDAVLTSLFSQYEHYTTIGRYTEGAFNA